MSTRSNIALRNADGSVTAIYCHFDGYVEGVGQTLETHYRDPAKVAALIALGSISILGAEIGEKHDFNDRKANPAWTLAYGRDRGDDDSEARTYKSSAALLRNARGGWIEFVYIYDAATGWRVYPGCQGRGKPLSVALERLAA